MTDMVERVARAVEAAYDDRSDDFVDWKKLARAVIEAMREPTEAMIDAGMVPTYQWVEESPDDVWGRMIDAALAP